MVAGGVVVAFYQFAYGIAAFGVGPLATSCPMPIGVSLLPGTTGSYKTAIGLTGEPVPVGSRSGAMMHRNDQRPTASHAWASSVN